MSDPETIRRMVDPQPGDVFHEMYSYYVMIVARQGDNVEFVENHPPCTLPEDGVRGTLSLSEFRDKFRNIGAVGGYWISWLRPRTGDPK